MFTIQRPALYKTKTLHSKEMYSTNWFGDDVIRFAPAAGWPNRCATLMQPTMTSLHKTRLKTALWLRSTNAIIIWIFAWFLQVCNILICRHYGRIMPLTINLQSMYRIGYIHKSCTIYESWKKLWTIPFSFLLVVPVASLLSLRNALLKIHLFVNKKESLYKVYTNLHVKYYI